MSTGGYYRELLTLDGTPYHRVDTDDIPLGHAAVDVLLKDDGQTFDTAMVAGLVATRISDSHDTSLSEDGSRDVVSPAPGWWIFIKKQGRENADEYPGYCTDLDSEEFEDGTIVIPNYGT